MPAAHFVGQDRRLYPGVPEELERGRVRAHHIEIEVIEYDVEVGGASHEVDIFRDTGVVLGLKHFHPVRDPVGSLLLLRELSHDAHHLAYDASVGVLGEEMLLEGSLPETPYELGVVYVRWAAHLAGPACEAAPYLVEHGVAAVQDGMLHHSAR